MSIVGKTEERRVLKLARWYATHLARSWTCPSVSPPLFLPPFEKLFWSCVKVRESWRCSSLPCPTLYWIAIDREKERVCVEELEATVAVRLPTQVFNPYPADLDPQQRSIGYIHLHVYSYKYRIAKFEIYSLPKQLISIFHLEHTHTPPDTWIQYFIVHIQTEWGKMILFLIKDGQYF